MLKRIAAFPEQCHSNDLIVQLQLLQWALYTTKRLWWLFHYVYTYTCIRLFGSRFRNWSKFKWSCRLLAKSLHRSRFSSDLTNRATHSRLGRRLFWRRLPVTDDYFDRYTFTFQLYGPSGTTLSQTILVGRITKNTVSQGLFHLTLLSLVNAFHWPVWWTFPLLSNRCGFCALLASAIARVSFANISNLSRASISWRLASVELRKYEKFWKAESR